MLSWMMSAVSLALRRRPVRMPSWMRIFEVCKPCFLGSCLHGGISHRLVPFVLEEGGRFGDHAQEILMLEIAELGAQTGKLKVPESWSCSNPKAASAYWVRKWKQEVSGWLQVTWSDTLLRQTSRASVNPSRISAGSG